MDFTLTDEQKMLREGADRYLAEHYDFDKRRALIDRDGGYSETQWRQFAEMGWLALALPEDCDGLAGSAVEISLIMEAMGKRLVLEPFATTAILCARLIDGSEDKSLRAELLKAIAAGTARIALAHGEIDSRYDLESVNARARRASRGFVITGRKIAVWDAPSAHHLIVSAVIEGDTDFSLFIVERNATGLEQHGFRLIDSTQCADVNFASAPAKLLLSSAEALTRLEEATDRMVLARVAETLGILEQVLQLTAEQLRNRSQFGQPLAKFQALQHRMAEMFVEVQEVRSILYRGLAFIEAPEAERKAAISVAKVVANSASRIVGSQGIQLHGGVGMTDEYAVGHYFKRLIALEKAYGDSDYHLKRIARTYHGSKNDD
jgi:alkylation response protein AidB-like acyl-CoA dehydrogenase